MFASMHKRSLLFYQATVLFFIIILSVALLYFWKNGYLDGTKNRKLSDISYKLKNLEERSEFENVKSLLFKNDIKRSLKSLTAFTNQISEIDRSIKIDEVEGLYTKIQNLESSIKDIAQFPKVKEILRVYNEKMSNFENFVYFNNWKTLSRLSKRINARMSSLHFSDSSFFTAITENEKDINQMKAVAENSVLVKTLKTKIAERLDSLLVELSMLKDYLMLRKKSSELHNLVNTSFNKWLDKVVPEVTIQKLKTEQVGKLYFSTFSIITACFFALFLLGFPISKRLILKGKDEQESEILTIIEKSFIEENVEGFTGASLHFKRKIEQYSKHLRKRMNFGSIFQESLPFDSILVDENLKIVWGNEHFFDKWGIAKENIIKETISWDYLAKIIDFGENDPVIDALKNNLGGIFEVKVELPNRSEKVSYEVYVSPVENNGKNHAMIFFYCLESLQTAITDYQATMMTPVEKMMNIFSIQMNKTDLQSLKVLFDDKELSPIYKKFETLYDSIKISNDSFMNQVDKLENEVQELTTKLDNETNELKNKLENETSTLSSRLENETAILSTKIEDQVEEYEEIIESQKVNFNEKYTTMKNEYEEILKQKVEMYEFQIAEIKAMNEDNINHTTTEYENVIQKQKTDFENEINLLTDTFKEKYQDKMSSFNNRLKSDTSMLEEQLVAQREEYQSMITTQGEFYKSKIQKIAKENMALISGNQTLKKELTSIKETLIDITSNNKNLVHNSMQTVELFSKSLNNYKEIVQRNEQVYSSLRQGLVSVPNVEDVRKEFQLLRTELQESKQNVFLNFQQLVNFKKYVKDFEGKKKLHDIVSAAKANIKDLDEKTNLLDQRFKFIEYQISSTTNLLKQNCDTNFENRLKTDLKIIGAMENGKEIVRKRFDTISNSSEQFEDNVINSIKNVYETYKKSNASSHTISEEINLATKYQVDGALASKTSSMS